MTIQKARPTRRVWLPAFFLGLFGALLAARLFQLQVLQHEAYAAQARRELLGDTTIYARRGAILDRNGGVLATTVAAWDVYLNRNAWPTPALREQALSGVAAITRIPRAHIEQALQERPGVEIRIATDLDYELGLRLIEAELPGVVLLPDFDYELGLRLIEAELPGVVLLPDFARVHPEGDLAGSILGFTGLENTGLAGIEAFYNEILQGRPGRAIYERDTLGDPIPYGQYVATEPTPGDDLVLTIDRHLQRLAEERLAAAVKEHKASGGSIIVMDPFTGEILATPPSRTTSPPARPRPSTRTSPSPIPTNPARS